MRGRVIAGCICVLLVGFVLTGCESTPEPVDEPAIAEDDGTSGESVGEGSFDVGITEISEGRSRAVGILGYSELEGGFWALYDTEPGEIPEGAPVVAVIANMGELDTSACSLEGKLVAADGTMSDGVSIRMAGPEIIADDVYEVPAE